MAPLLSLSRRSRQFSVTGEPPVPPVLVPPVPPVLVPPVPPVLVPPVPPVPESVPPVPESTPPSESQAPLPPQVPEPHLVPGGRLSIWQFVASSGSQASNVQFWPGRP